MKIRFMGTMMNDQPLDEVAKYMEPGLILDVEGTDGEVYPFVCLSAADDTKSVGLT